tara:strand:+ start:33 stop:710 length:678 start_codon:yes stop_codon:yes gene_type:complete
MLKFKTFEELLENEGLKKKAAKSGISYGTLKKVYNRGMAAWRTGHRPGTTPQQWGMARVNSYIGKGKGTYYGADSDLSGKGKKKSKKESVNEISKNLAKSYMSKAARDMYHKGQQQGTADAISRLGGPDQDYKKSPERKAAMRVRGMDRATNRLMKKEAMSDAEKAAHQKAIDAFKAKGGKVKKLKPGYAAGYHGKADPGAGMKGMISPADTKQFGTKKKVGSMK